jgi:integrase
MYIGGIRMGKDLSGKKLGNGISQRKAGDYEGRYIDSYGKRVSIYRVSLSDLKKELLIRKSAVATPSPVRKLYTVEQWYRQWMEVYKYEVRDSTRLVYSQVYEKHISGSLGKLPLPEVTSLAVKKFLNQLKKQGLGYETRNKARIVLLDMFDKAIIDNFAVKNPIRGLKVARDEETEPAVLSKEDQVDFFDTCKGTFYDELFVVAVLTGLRPGELYALRWQDIDLAKKRIHVTRTLLYQKLEGDAGKTYHIHPPKTETSNRYVYFDDRCALALKSQFRKKSNVALRISSSPLPDLADLLFITQFNTPLNATTYSTAISRIVEVVNQSRGDIEQMESFSGHCFRHTYATRCFEAGVDPKVVQSQLGHANLKMTMDLYTHLFPDKELQELDKFNSYTDHLFGASDDLSEHRYQNALHPKVIPLRKKA